MSALKVTTFSRRHSQWWRNAALTLLLAAGGFSMPGAEASAGPIVLAERLTVDAAALRHGELVSRLYAMRSQQPLWTDKRGLTKQGQRLLEFLPRVAAHGLAPDYYHATSAGLLSTQQDAPSLAQLDLLLSDAFIGLALDFSHGVAQRDPQVFARAVRAWRGGPIFQLLSMGSLDDPVELLIQHLPTDPEYWALVRAGEHQPELAEYLYANLERLRTGGAPPSGTHIAVNIAAQELAYIRDGTTILTMRVIVGRPDRPTPLIDSKIDQVVFNPSWNVPSRIAIRDKLPKIRKNPAYLADNGYLLRNGWESDATLVDPLTVDWAQVTASNFPYAIQQKPGPGNALGRVKFLFPNDYSVYLHDTSSPELFAQERRLFSSGCVRLERPMELARQLLRDQGQDVVPSGAAEDPGMEMRVTLQQPVPVVFQYRTVWLDPAGRLQLGEDVYGRDAQILAALRDPTRAPQSLLAQARPALQLAAAGRAGSTP